MADRLDISTVRDLENVLRSSESQSYRAGAIEKLKKWRDEPGLEKDAETEALIDKLLRKYGHLHP